jgi:hypothetical protein
VQELAHRHHVLPLGDLPRGRKRAAKRNRDLLTSVPTVRLGSKADVALPRESACTRRNENVAVGPRFEPRSGSQPLTALASFCIGLANPNCLAPYCVAMYELQDKPVKSPVDGVGAVHWLSVRGVDHSKARQRIEVNDLASPSILDYRLYGWQRPAAGPVYRS